MGAVHWSCSLLGLGSGMRQACGVTHVSRQYVSVVVVCKAVGAACQLHEMIGWVVERMWWQLLHVRLYRVQHHIGVIYIVALPVV